MTIFAIIPPEFEAIAKRLQLSPAIVSSNHLYLSGITGTEADGKIPDNLDAQIRTAFDKIGVILAEAGLGYQSIVEMTTYHIGLREHFEMFNAIRIEYCGEPFPAWTAVEVAGLQRKGINVEIRVVANMDV
ncbi:MAG: RidA family protein [Cohaesibacteraceae bacterium]|nr:RidA family protein [Cohaesibacteraceae bacterium]